MADEKTVINVDLNMFGQDADAKTAVVGTVLAAGRDGIDIACGQGALRLRVLQREGGKAITAADYLNARRDLHVGA